MLKFGPYVQTLSFSFGVLKFAFQSYAFLLSIKSKSNINQKTRCAMWQSFAQRLTSNLGPSIKRTRPAYNQVGYVSIALINNAKFFCNVPSSSPNHALVNSLLPLFSHVLTLLRNMPNIADILKNLERPRPCLLLRGALPYVVYIQPNLIEKVHNKNCHNYLKMNSVFNKFLDLFH